MQNNRSPIRGVIVDLSDQLREQEPFIRRCARRNGLQHEDANDVCQEVAINCCQLVEDWSVPKPALIRMLAKRRIVDAARAKSRRLATESFDDSNVQHNVQRGHGVETMALLQDDVDQLRTAIQALSPPKKQVLIEHYYHSKSHKRIASDIGQPIETIRTRYKRAIESMRGMLS
jgi:RNA polymerase sigma factor (sigma-70 family)